MDDARAQQHGQNRRLGGGAAVEGTFGFVAAVEIVREIEEERAMRRRVEEERRAEEEARKVAEQSCDVQHNNAWASLSES